MRRDEFEQVLILLQMMFLSVSGHRAGAQKPTPSIHELLPVSAHRDLSGIFRSIPSRSASHRVFTALFPGCFRCATCYKGL
jgi:hypothetical protein